MDTVFLHNLSLKGKHGVHQHERDVEQEFIIDIDAAFDTTRSAESDELTDTVDYSDFKAICERVVKENSFYLLEKLADTIARELLADERIIEVRVSIRKPAVYTHAVPGVSIVRANS